MIKISLPDIPEKDRSPIINMLLKVIERQQQTIENFASEVTTLKAEIKRLKNHPKRPKIKPSKMDKNNHNGKGDESGSKRPGSEKRKKHSGLTIDKTEIIKANAVPFGAEFKGYDKFIIQDLEIKTVNTKYKLERWLLPNGSYRVGELPEHLKGSHFGPVLRSYIVYQYHHLCVTQPLLLDQLREFGIDISSGQLNRLLIEGKEVFHEEKDDILRAGLSISKYINVDDTGARHKGNNGYCAHIGNELFAWFESTESKSRINFLELLRAGKKDYRVDDNALDYMKQQRLPAKSLKCLSENNHTTFNDALSWESHLKSLGITEPRHIKIATEGALTGSVLSHGFNLDLAIVSDDAGQFNIFQHALCWVHAERKINELIPLSNHHAAAIDTIRRFFWLFYDDLKKYKQSPNEKQKEFLSRQFDVLFNTQTNFETLNQVLKRLRRNKGELLLVLDRPELPLHNNLSERDIREYVKRRKVSGGTRSDEGRRCRDTFASLKKTCKKLKIRFWDYVPDRIRGDNKILKLSALINQTASG
jgi:hypothetical protein